MNYSTYYTTHTKIPPERRFTMSTTGSLYPKKESFLNRVVRRETAFKSFNDMIEHSKGSYTPTLRADVNLDLIAVANAFDDKMQRLGINKKAHLITSPCSKYLRRRNS